MASTTLTQLDYKFREYLAEMDVAWSWPSVFMASDGEPLVGLETWTAGSFEVKGYGKEKHYEWPIEWSAPFSLTPGGIDFDTSVNETGSHAKMYAKKVYAPILLDKELAEFKGGQIQLGAAAANELDYRIKLALGSMEAYYQQVFWGDGTGRRARVYSIIEGTPASPGGGTYSTIYLRPMWATNAAPGAFDATKYLVENEFVRLGLWDETAASGVGSGSWYHANSNLRRIVQIHVGTSACGRADAPYIVVTPQILTSGGGAGSTIPDPTYYYVFIEHPETGGTADKEVQGVNAWMGDGYNAHTNAATGANNSGYPAFGRRVYATIDRYTDDTYAKFRGHVYNRQLATPCAAVPLTTAVIDDWLTDYYAKCPRDASGKPYRIEAFVANSHLRSKFATVFATQGTVFLNDTDIPHKIGWRSPAIIDSYGPGGSRIVPLFFAEDAPRNSIHGFCFKPLKHGIVEAGRWSPGDPGYGPFRDVSNITEEDVLKALYKRTEMFIQHRPAAQTSCLFVTE